MLVFQGIYRIADCREITAHRDYTTIYRVKARRSRRQDTVTL